MRYVKNLRAVTIVLLGNIFLALGAAAFAVPHEFAMTGVNGIALACEHYLGLNLSITIGLVNLACFAVGLWIFGKDFAAKTLLSTVVYPVILNFFMRIPALSHITGDTLLAVVISGVLFGAGLGMIFREGGSSGGVDILCLALNKKFNIPVASAVNGVSIATLLLQMLYLPSEKMLYGVISSVITSLVLSYVMLYGNYNVQVLIISEAHAVINELLQDKLQRGTTLFPVETGHLHQTSKAVLCVFSMRELAAVTEAVQQLDSKAFIVVSNAREVRGVGFTLPRM